MFSQPLRAPMAALTRGNSRRAKGCWNLEVDRKDRWKADQRHCLWLNKSETGVVQSVAEEGNTSCVASRERQRPEVLPLQGLAYSGRLRSRLAICYPALNLARRRYGLLGLDGILGLDRPPVDGPPAGYRETFGFLLIEKVFSPANLAASTAKVVANKGAAGVDHVSVEQLDLHADENLEILREQLRAGRYQPLAIRRVFIPKPGPAEKRSRPRTDLRARFRTDQLRKPSATRRTRRAGAGGGVARGWLWLRGRCRPEVTRRARRSERPSASGGWSPHGTTSRWKTWYVW